MLYLVGTHPGGNVQPEAIELREKLHAALQKIGPLETCVCVDVPTWYNLGSHALWVAMLRYLTQEVGARIGYVASAEQFAADEMEARVGKAPLLLRGGYLGDFWRGGASRRQQFFLHLIARYHDRPIVILPQSFFYSDLRRLAADAAVLNAHPDLTFFARDQASYESAQAALPRCRVVLAPDSVFELADLSDLPEPPPSRFPVLYLCREDWSADSTYEPSRLNIKGMLSTDWKSFAWNLRQRWTFLRKHTRLEQFIQEVWQRRLRTPREWISRRAWEGRVPSAVQLAERMHRPEHYLRAWSLLHAAFYQLTGC